MVRLSRPILVLLVVVVGALAAGLAVEDSPSETNPDRTRVTVVDEDDTLLGTVSVRIANTPSERYTGLSNAESLGSNEGMLFVYGSTGNRTYVMRDMDFSIDIVFVGADREVTEIHHADVEEPPLTSYRGRGKWVLEVPYDWTRRHGVSVGDRIRIAGEGS